MPRTSRGVRAITWVEKYCLYPAGPHRGERVCLSMAERDTVRRLYDGSDGLRGVPVSGPLAGYLTLMHICGPEAVSGGGSMPEFNVDFFTLWNATGPELRAVLRRDGYRVVCPELGTRWPTAA